MSNTPAPDAKPTWPKRVYQWAASRTAVALITLSLGALVALVVVAGTQGYLLDWELLLEYVKVLWGWPAVVLILGVVLRKSLPTLLENGGEWEGFGLKGKINQRARDSQENSQDVATNAKEKVAQFKEEVSKIERPAGSELTPMPAPGSADFQDLVTLAAEDPARAMNEAWSLIGQRLVQIQEDPDYRGIPSRSLQDVAVQQAWNDGLIDVDWLTEYADLREQRFRRGRRWPSTSVPFVIAASNLYAALDEAAVRKWAKDNNISLVAANNIFRHVQHAEANKSTTF